MAYDSLKNIIRQYIKTNGEQEITGQIMQNVLIEMVNNYPSTDGYATQSWVNTQLAGYLPLSGGTMTGSINFTSSAYGINFSDGSQGIGDISYSSLLDGLLLHSNRKIVLDCNTIWAEGNLTANSFIKDGGTSAQFLKADGSVDSNTYITSASLAGYLPLSGGTMTGSINFTSSAYGINFTDGSQGSGDISYSSLIDGLLLHSNRKIILDCNTIWAEGNLTATSFIKDGGTSSQFLKADGSVDSNTYITSAALASYLPLTGGTMTGSINFTSTAYGINFTDGSQGSGDISYSSLIDGLLLHSNRKIILDCNTIWAEGNLTATSFIKDGGTSSQFLKADGSVDSNTYITSAALAGYLPLTGGTMTGSINFMSSAAGINFSDGSQAIGDISYSSLLDGLLLHSNTKIVLDCNTIWAEGNLTATSFIKDGGTSAQFLKADGSVDSSAYITSAALAGYLPLTGGTVTGAVNLATNSGNVGIGTTSPFVTLDVIGTIMSNRLRIWGGEVSDDSKGLYIQASDKSTRAYITYRGNIAADGLLRIGTEFGNIAIMPAGNKNVGIATNSPAYRLDVNGSANATTLYENGTSLSSKYLALTGGTLTGDLTLNNKLIFNGSIRSIKFNTYTYISNSSTTLKIIHESTSDIIIGNYDNGNYTSIVNDLQGGTTDGTYNSVTQKWLIQNSGDAYFKSVGQQSDIRYKNVIGDVVLNLYNVANAPIFKFTWKDETRDTGQHIGTAAQYWQTILPELVSMGTEKNPKMSMQYDVIALASAITVAKTVVDHEQRISILERENQALREEIARLTAA